MSPESRFLAGLHADMPAIAHRVTNIYSRREIIIEPYVAAHMDVDKVVNVLIATRSEYEQHLRVYGHTHPIDELIEGRATHLGEMSNPAVRGVIWRIVDQV
jgi:acetolactate synthase small subunit